MTFDCLFFPTSLQALQLMPTRADLMSDAVDIAKALGTIDDKFLASGKQFHNDIRQRDKECTIVKRKYFF